ncbi:NAD(P)/FAD-dependent oxidoreductase [Labrys wisconsinensis]|uniref:D-amino-acid dehydrogenase n=1 Tax=Labrys wisconsinensis TaxID=425677 RepID=A0ABU0JAV9_9HYPH|nr:FAD-binding oxidoreductase [Labrys wisconsinensis]MDQ0470563.1 D-amino-acid dehydrogenase [Labrys wisconsinensis]
MDGLDAAPVPEGERRRVAVIGAGLVGLASALWLARLGHHVTVVDRAPPEPGGSYRQACSYGNACTVAPHGVVPVATPGIAWRVPGMVLNPAGPLAIVWRYLPHLAPWLRAFLAASRPAEVERIAGTLAGLLRHADAAYRPLVEEAGARHLERHAGCLYLYRSDAAFAAAEADNRLRERHGVALERLDAVAIRALEPRLAPLYRRGVLYPDAYTFDSPQVLAVAFAAAIRKRGGAIVRAEVRDLRCEGEGVRVGTDGTALRAERLVIAAGAHSRALVRQLGEDVLLDTERGYHVLFPEAGHLLGRPVCYPEHGFYMTPMADGLRAAGTVELGGLAVPARPVRTRMIRQTVAELLPQAGAPGAEWMGFRPSMPDSLPVVARSARHPAVTYAFGHGHLGLTLAGITGRLVADLVSERPPVLPLATLRHDRFDAWGGKPGPG